MLFSTCPAIKTNLKQIFNILQDQINHYINLNWSRFMDKTRFIPILFGFHPNLWGNKCSIRWINWNQKLKLKSKKRIFLSLTFRLCYTLLKKRPRKLFSPYKKMFSCPPLFKTYKNVNEFSFTPTKTILVFSFWFLGSVYPTNRAKIRMKLK